jgi:hypothetical protein
MGNLRKTVLGTGVLALLMTSAAPAFAGRGGYGGYGYGSGYGSFGYGGRGYGGHKRHRRGDNDTAEVLGGVLIGALLVGVLSSASKKSKRNRDASADNYPRDDNRTNNGTNNGTSNNQRGNIASEDQAVDACAVAAEDKSGRSSSVRDITTVRKNTDGWDVEGVIENRDNWRDRSASKRNFICSVRYGAVDSVYIDDRAVAFNAR